MNRFISSNLSLKFGSLLNSAVSRAASRNNSLIPSRNPSRSHSRAASPVIQSGEAGDATLPLMLCSLLQREFSGSKSSGGGRGSRKGGGGHRKRGEEEDEEEGIYLSINQFNFNLSTKAPVTARLHYYI